MTLALVTGASRGIGRATALGLAQRRVDLLLLGRPSAELDATLERIARLGGSARSIHCDLADSAQIRAASAAVLAQGTPEIVIHNAAVIERRSVEDTDDASLERQLAVNLRAPFQLTRDLLPAMRKARRGRILHVGSIASTIGSPNAAAYAASKWGLIGLMKSLAAELSDSGLITLAVLPGSVDTEMLAGSGFKPRMTAEDVARTLVFHALDAPLAHNGAVIEMFGI